MPFENAKQNLADFSKKLGLKDIAFDNSNTCILSIDGEFPMHLTYESNADRLFIYSPLLDELPTDTNIRLKLYETLLSGSMLGGQMAGGGVGIALKESLILMHCTLDMGHADALALRKFAPLYVETVEKWRNTCVEICLSEAYEKGKNDYIAGNYESAYDNLLRAANAGHKYAEYYLSALLLAPNVYFNPENANKWLEKSLEKNFICEWIKKSAEGGDKLAQSMYGYMFEMGKGKVKQDYKQAARWYELSAKQGYYVAQFNLGRLYQYGTGVNKNLIEAKNLYICAAQQDFINAHHQLGIIYQEEENYAEAVNHFSQAAAKGLVASQHETGLHAEYGKGVAQNYTRAFDWYTKAAEQNNGNAQAKLSEFYAKGLGGVSKDHTKAVYWCRKAAEQGIVSSQHLLAIYYDYGIGVGKDKGEATKLYRMAANKDYVSSVLKLAARLEDKQEKIEQYMKAVRLGSAEAAVELGGIYYKGKITTKDNAQAFKWYYEAANKGRSNAQARVGYMHYHGEGIGQDYDKALIWLKKAAAQGNEEAMYTVGTMYEEGKGCKADSNEAMRWYHESAKKDYTPADAKINPTKYNRKPITNEIIVSIQCEIHGKKTFIDRPGALSAPPTSMLTGHFPVSTLTTQQQGMLDAHVDGLLKRLGEDSLESALREADEIRYSQHPFFQSKQSKLEDKGHGSTQNSIQNNSNPSFSSTTVTQKNPITTKVEEKNPILPTQAASPVSSATVQKNEKEKEEVSTIKPPPAVEPKKTTVTTTTTSSTYNPGFFHPTVTPAQAIVQKSQDIKQKKHVTEGEVTDIFYKVGKGLLDPVQAILKKNHALLYTTSNYMTDITGKAYTDITVLQYAFIAGDIGMCKMILAEFKKDEERWIAHQLNPEVIKQHGGVFTLESTLQAYRDLESNWNNWSEKKRDEQWCKVIGGLQRSWPAWLRYDLTEEAPARTALWTTKQVCGEPRMRNDNKQFLTWDIGGILDKSRLGTDYAWARLNYSFSGAFQGTTNNAFFTLGYVKRNEVVYDLSCLDKEKTSMNVYRETLQATFRPFSHTGGGIESQVPRKEHAPQPSNFALK